MLRREIARYLIPNITRVETTPSALPTIGNGLVTISGNNFGPLGTKITGTFGGQFGDLFQLSSCVLVIPYHAATCSTSSGTGSNLNWKIFVDEQPSEIFSSDVSFAKPTITAIEGAVNMSTTGGEIVTLFGDNFGAFGTHVSVVYGGEYNANNCHVTVDHYTAERKMRIGCIGHSNSRSSQ